MTARYATATRSIASRIAIVDELAAFARIFDSAVNAVVYQRSVPPPVDAEVDRVLDALRLPLKIVVEANGTHAALRDRLASDALVEDIACWAEILADLAEAPLIGIRLARLDTAMCPRFHTDRILMRLVTTYRGRGTEILDDDDVLECQVGEVLVMKGDAWPGNDRGGTVHRSPQIKSPRLVLTLDPLA